MIEDLALLGIAAIFVLAVVIQVCIIQRIHSRANKPPPLSAEENTRRLEKELAEVNKKIEEIGE